MKVSIIMPVYCAEKYVEHAALSILQQDFDDFELIAVDDGSTDHSLEILGRLAESYSNLVVVHRKNGGICSARNKGLSLARGEYIGFCDNDDEYLPGLIKDNYELAKSQNADLVRYGRIKYEILENGMVHEDVTTLPDAVFDRETFARNFKLIRGMHTVWTGLYRREILEAHQIRFTEQFQFGAEDSMFNLQFLEHCNRIAINSKSYYRWMHRDAHSTSRKFHLQFLKNYHDCMEKEYELILKLGEKNIDESALFWVVANYYISFIINYISMPSCTLSLKQKAKILKKYRKHPIYDSLFDDGVLIHFKETPILGAMAWLFYYRAYSLELILYKLARKAYDVKEQKNSHKIQNGE